MTPLKALGLILLLAAVLLVGITLGENWAYRDGAAACGDNH